MSKRHSANDHRSIVKNPNNPAYGADRANRGALGHPNVPPPPAAPPPATTQPEVATTKK
jgi:hypothetical protein